MNEQLSTAVDGVAEILLRSTGNDPPFPPTELYSEGWMLRLVMDSHQQGNRALPIPLSLDATWYSEARLASPFQPSQRGDPYGETQTHADGVIGSIVIRPGTTAGLSLSPHATQFVVIEAKMGSKLSAGTTRVPWYDQAARTVAAMAWTMWEADRTPDSFESLAFIVVGPQERILTERTIAMYANKPSITDKLQRRIDLYRDDAPERHQQLETFYQELFLPFMEHLDIFLFSWENVLDWTEPAATGPLAAFYKQCLIHNGLLP